MSKSHWENIYSTKKINEFSWYQPTPETSLTLIEELNLPTDAAIIDIGGGDSYLVDHLIEKGFKNLSVLDISKNALDRAKERLGDEKSMSVKWIETDIREFSPSEKYHCWHDRATFHFLTEESDIRHYRDLVSEYILKDGYLIIGTFAEDGPQKCSGFPISQYNEVQLAALFSENFELLKSLRIKHKTPFDTEQSFVFVVLKRR